MSTKRLQLFPVGVLYDSVDCVYVGAGVAGRVAGDNGASSHFVEG